MFFLSGEREPSKNFLAESWGGSLNCVWLNGAHLLEASLSNSSAKLQYGGQPLDPGDMRMVDWSFHALRSQLTHAWHTYHPSLWITANEIQVMLQHIWWPGRFPIARTCFRKHVLNNRFCMQTHWVHFCVVLLRLSVYSCSENCLLTAHVCMLLITVSSLFPFLRSLARVLFPIMQFQFHCFWGERSW